MSDNLKIYDAVREVPENAKRPIQGGKLKGKTDINPMWRLKTLTEQFGPCGIGWWYTINKQWTEPGAGGTVAAFVDIDLYYKLDGVMSVPIPGTGGSMLVDLEKGKLVTNDEAYKMALTDAISVACKAIGVAADVYWEADTTKYDKQGDPPPAPKPPQYVCTACGQVIADYQDANGKRVSAERHVNGSLQKFGQSLCPDCIKRMQDQALREIAQRAAERGVPVNTHDPGKSGF